MYFDLYGYRVHLSSKVVSSGLHTKWRRLAAGFKASYPTERTDHATIAWSDCAINVYIIIIINDPRTLT